MQTEPSSKFKVGDLVIRKNPDPDDGSMTANAAREQRERLGYGIVVSKQIAGNPAHLCITVLYPKAGKTYEIAESLMESAGDPANPWK